jgi:hypothetical protein
MKRLSTAGRFFAAVGAVTLAVAVSEPARGQAAEGAAAQSSRTVVTGDTLWDIAGACYNDPYQWRTIWEANRQTVADPDRIYPDQVLTIPERGAAAAPRNVAATDVPPAALVERAAAPAVADAAPTAAPDAAEDDACAETAALAPVAVPEEPADQTAAAAEYAPEMRMARAASAEETVPLPPAGKRYYSSDSFVAPVDWVAEGMIVRDRDKKLMISEGDTVFVNIGADRASPGTRYQICRRGEKMKDMTTGDVIGYEVRIVGALELTAEIGPEISTAKIINSREPLEIGDLVTQSK